MDIFPESGSKLKFFCGVQFGFSLKAGPVSGINFNSNFITSSKLNLAFSQYRLDMKFYSYI